VKKWLITVDSCEDVTYTELSDDDYTILFESEMADAIEEKMEDSFIFGDVTQGDFVLLNLARKKNIFHYIAEVMNDFDGNEYEIRYYKWIETTNKFIPDKKKKEYFSIHNTDISRKLPPPVPARSPKKARVTVLFSSGF
jgi:hypothetical protein